MLNSSSSVQLTMSRAMLLAFYLVGIAFMLPSLMEFLLVSYPYRMGTAQWRFGALGLLFNSVLFSPIIGLAICAVVSRALGHGIVSRLVAILSGLIALLLLAGLPFFVLDFLQLRALINPEAKRAFDFTSLKASLTAGIMFLTSLSIAVAAWRAPGDQTQGVTARTAPRPKSPVVMGSAQAPQG